MASAVTVLAVLLLMASEAAGCSYAAYDSSAALPVLSLKEASNLTEGVLLPSGESFSLMQSRVSLGSTRLVYNTSNTFNWGIAKAFEPISHDGRLGVSCAGHANDSNPLLGTFLPSSLNISFTRLRLPDRIYVVLGDPLTLCLDSIQYYIPVKNDARDCSFEFDISAVKYFRGGHGSAVYVAPAETKRIPAIFDPSVECIHLPLLTPIGTPLYNFYAALVAGNGGDGSYFDIDTQDAKRLMFPNPCLATSATLPGRENVIVIGRVALDTYSVMLDKRNKRLTLSRGEQKDQTQEQCLCGPGSRHVAGTAIDEHTGVLIAQLSIGGVKKHPNVLPKGPFRVAIDTNMSHLIMKERVFHGGPVVNGFDVSVVVGVLAATIAVAVFFVCSKKHELCKRLASDEYELMHTPMHMRDGDRL